METVQRKLDRRDFFKSCAAAAALSGLGPPLTGCSRPKSPFAALPADRIPGITRRSGNVFLMENHNVAHLVWHALGIRNATVVHVDTHDDFRHVDPDRLNAVARLVAQGDYAQLYEKTEIEFAFEQKIHPSDMLFDLGNFLFPCMADKTISQLHWVVPDPKISPETGDRLALHFQNVLQLSSLPPVSHPRDGFMEIDLGFARLTVSTLEALPSFPPGTLLDLDVDFFAFPHALAGEHLPGKLLWDIPDTCEQLRRRVPNPAVTTICSSVWGGYLPLLFRFLADSCFDFMTSGQYPEYARTMLGETVAIRAMSRPPRPLDPPTDSHYMPGWTFLQGMLQLARGLETEGLDQIEQAARSLPVYRKGLLDAAEALLFMNKPDSADRSILRFEHVNGGATTHSKVWKARTLLAMGELKAAEQLSLSLVEWERQPFHLMLYGGVLTEQQRFKEAGQIYADVIRMDPNNGGAYYNMGVVLDRQEKAREASDYYSKAIQLKPLFADAHENLGYLRLRQKRMDEAITHFDQAVRINPLKVKAWGNLGVAHAAKGDHTDAIRCFRRAIELNPDMAELHFFLATELLATDQSDAAVKQCKEALRLRPGWEGPTEMMRTILTKGFQ